MKCDCTKMGGISGNRYSQLICVYTGDVMLLQILALCSIAIAIAIGFISSGIRALNAVEVFPSVRSSTPP